MEIHQVVVSASPGDAITNAACQVRDLLRQLGPSEIYSYNIHPDLIGDVLPLDSYTRRLRPQPAGDIIVFHASIGQPEVFSFLLDRPEQLVLVYHNISPAEPFLPYDPAFAGLLEAGRRELAILRDRVVLALADSEFNALELIELGYRDVRVVPLIIDIAGRLEVEPDEGTTNHLTSQVEGPVILCVAQLLPHKRPDLLIQAYHTLVTFLIPEAHLILVGPPRLPKFHQAVQLYVQELNLSRAWVTGRGHGRSAGGDVPPGRPVRDGQRTRGLLRAACWRP